MNVRVLMMWLFWESEEGKVKSGKSVVEMESDTDLTKGKGEVSQGCGRRKAHLT